MSAFMVNTNVMAKVVTAILLNFDTFDGRSLGAELRPGSTRETAGYVAPMKSEGATFGVAAVFVERAARSA